jgi:HemK-related putative methylase
MALHEPFRNAARALRTRVARPLLCRLRMPFVARALAAPGEARFLGYTLRTDPRVFHPVHFSSSRVLAEYLLAQRLVGQGILDMGTGAGPIAVVAAGAGARVTACDLNPYAVALAQTNLAKNGLPGEVLESDLFAALGGRRFDLISFNVPFFAGEPSDLLDAAYRAGPDLQTIARFAEGSRAHLEPGGRVVLICSEDGDRDKTLGLFAHAGLVLDSETRTRRLLEDFYVASLRPVK